MVDERLFHIGVPNGYNLIHQNIIFTGQWYVVRIFDVLTASRLCRRKGCRPNLMLRQPNSSFKPALLYTESLQPILSTSIILPLLRLIFRSLVLRSLVLRRLIFGMAVSRSAAPRRVVFGRANSRRLSFWKVIICGLVAKIFVIRQD